MGRPRIPPKTEGLLDAVESALEGDEEGLEEWHRRRFPSLALACTRWSGDEGLGERIASAVVRVAFQRMQGGVEVESERAWIAGVAALERLELLREDRLGELPLPGGLLARARGPVERALHQEERELVRAAIRTLPAKYRLPLWLRYVRDASESETADWVRSWAGVGPEATRKLLKEGRRMVAAVLEGEDPRRRWPRRYSRRNDRWSVPPPPLPPRMKDGEPDVPAP